MNEMELQHLTDLFPADQDQVHLVVEASHEISQYEKWYAAFDGNEGYSIPVLSPEDLNEYTEHDPLELTMDNAEIVCTFGKPVTNRRDDRPRQVVCMGFPWDEVK